MVYADNNQAEFELHLPNGQIAQRLEYVQINQHGINQLLYGYLQWLSEEPSDDPLISANPCLLSNYANQTRQWPLWLLSISKQPLKQNWYRYRAQVGGPLAYCQHHNIDQAWQNRQPQTILQQIWHSIAPANMHLEWAIAHNQPSIPHSIQYQENSTHLWQRICQNMGWYFVFLPNMPGTLWIGENLSDLPLSKNAHPLLLPYRPRHNTQPTTKSGFISHIQSFYNMTPNSTHGHDFDLDQQQPYLNHYQSQDTATWGKQHLPLDQHHPAGWHQVTHGSIKQQQQTWLINYSGMDLLPGQIVSIQDKPDFLDDAIKWRVLAVSSYFENHVDCNHPVTPSQQAIITPFDQATYPNALQQNSAHSRLFRSGLIERSVDYYSSSRLSQRQHAVDNKGRYNIHYPGLTAIDNFHNPNQQHHTSLPLLQPWTSQPTQDNKPSGWHFGLKPGAQVITANLGEQHHDAIITGALSHPFHPNVVNEQHASDYRLRTPGGHAFIMRDTKHSRALIWHTRNNRQQLSLHHQPNQQIIRQHNRDGGWQTQSKTHTNWHIGHDHSLHIKGQQYLQSNNMSILGNTNWQEWIEQKLTISAATIQEQYKQGSFHIGRAHLNCQRGQIVAKHNLTWRHNQATMTAQQILLPSPCIQLGGVTISGNSISGSIAIQADKITWYKPTGGGSMGSQSTHIDRDQTKPSHHKADQLADLFAVNLRPDQPPELYHDESKARDAYSAQLPSQALQYFQQNGQNVTVFVHGYNVPYGEFGGDILIPLAYSRNPQREQTIPVTLPLDGNEWESQHQADYIKLKQAKLKASHQWLQHSIYHRRDIYRDPNNLKEHIPQAVVQMPDGSIVAPSHESLNGTGAHNWWLHMEYNLNYATGQLDTETFKNYTRLLHIAWAGDPTHSYDYLASVEQSQQAGNKLAPILQQLQQAGLKVNVIAHSLGNGVLLKALDQLGQQGIQLNHVFLWEPAVPNDCLANPPTNNNLCGLYHYPHAAQATDQMTVLYSQHDNVLGPPHNNVISQHWEKAQDNNSPSVNNLLESIIHVVDDLLPESDRLKSFYHLANLISQSLTPWLEDVKQCKQFYQNTWLNHYRTARYHTYGQRRLEPSLAKQCWVIDYLYSAPLNAVAAIIRSIQSLATNNTNHHQILISLDAIDKLKQDLKNNDRPYADPKTRAKHLRRWQRNQVSITQRGHKTAYTIIDWRKKPIKDKMKKHLHQLLRRHHQQFQQSLEYGMHGGVVTSNPHKTVSGIYDQAELIAAFIITALLTEGTDVKPALGYNGPDRTISNIKDKLKDGSIIPVDQKGILTSHSAMKDPSEAMMNEIYHKKIIGAKGYRLGLYKRVRIKGDE